MSARKFWTKKYESYLRHAGCDEILFSRDFSRRILANTSATNGMSHIIFELLSRDRSRSRLATCDIPPEFSGRAVTTHGGMLH